MVASSLTEEVAMIPKETFMDIISLHRQGHSMRLIARKLGLHRKEPVPEKMAGV
jgi:hypothetical protein